MAKLVDVYRSDRTTLGRRQLPLAVNENLTMVMDLNSMGLICDNKPVKGKELEEFTRKMELLTPAELTSALQVTKSDMLRVLNQAVPCVGCRRSVERLYYQLFKCGHPTLDPLTVNEEGVITLRNDKPITASVLATLFHGHSSRLNNLVDSQPRRSKKSHRCLLHSLESQRNRPVTSAWREVWECMRPQCREEVVLIEATALHATLENYLRKHRFCGECRTKVLRAYTLLVEQQEPVKEKGYVSALYHGIRRCLPDKHIHLQTKTDYISKLISRAEPELLGSRRERHAKTMEIAQEEVLTCLGICVYERLHRIFVRMREEECTCQVFAAVAVDTLCRSFETAVEKNQGISQLELLYEELTKEELLKQQRREQKKLKRRRKKERLADEKENCNRCETPAENNVPIKLCPCEINAQNGVKVTEKNKEAAHVNCKDCKKALDGSAVQEITSKDNNWFDNGGNCKCLSSKQHRKGGGVGGGGGGGGGNKSDTYTYSRYACEQDDSDVSEPTASTKGKRHAKEAWSSSEHSHDCGYSSENNNGCCETTSGASSLPSSPEGSEMACSGSCCNLAADCHVDYKYSKFFPRDNSIKLSLQQMLEDSFSSDEDGEESYIPAEEVQEFQTKTCYSHQQREELRQTLRNKFALLCVNATQIPIQDSRDYK